MKKLIATLAIISPAMLLAACGTGIDTKYYSGRFEQDGANAVYVSKSRVPINFSHDGKHLTGNVVQERRTWFEPAGK